MTERLSFEQLVEFNRILCADTAENSVLLDPDGLDAALERPWSGFGDVELFPSLFEKAAALLHAIASRQVFDNGNKRTAWAGAVAFLDLVQSSGDAALARAFPGGEATPATPLGTAMLWWLGLADVDEYRNALERLSLDPSLWGDYQLPAAAIADRSITTVLEPCPGDEAIKHIKFIEFAGDDAAVAIADAPLTDVFVLTVVKPEDSDWWLV